MGHGVKYRWYLFFKKIKISSLFSEIRLLQNHIFINKINYHYNLLNNKMGNILYTSADLDYNDNEDVLFVIPRQTELTRNQIRQLRENRQEQGNF